MCCARVFHQGIMNTVQVIRIGTPSEDVIVQRQVNCKMGISWCSLLDALSSVLHWSKTRKKLHTHTSWYVSSIDFYCYTIPQCPIPMEIHKTSLGSNSWCWWMLWTADNVGSSTSCSCCCCSCAIKLFSNPPRLFKSFPADKIEIEI